MTIDITAVGPYPAPAKLNLMLRIIGRREDGYHNLQTVFQFIDYWDNLYFRVRQDGKILRTNGPVEIPATQDLTVRAALALQTATDCRLGTDIILHKQLPIGSGLGGGSSDAATTLIALNKLWQLKLNTQELLDIGVKLGADVPVFIGGTAAWAEGIGEQLTPLTLAESWYVLIIPSCQVSTRKIFNHPELTRHSIPITIASFLAGDYTNDCTTVVRKLYLEVAEALDWLQDKLGDKQGRLTGTGACVFATCATESAATQVLTTMPKKWQGLVVKGLNRSPLINCIDI